MFHRFHHTLLFFLFFVQLTIAQDQHSLLQESSTWVEELNFSDGDRFRPDTTFYKEYYLEGDTLLNGETYKRLMSDNQVDGFLREEDGRLLAWNESNAITDTLLDFNLSIGDTIIIESYEAFDPFNSQFMVLENIDSVQLRDGVIRKRLNFYGHNAGTFLFQDFEIAWTDGIGSTRGLLIRKDCGVLRKGVSSPVCLNKLLCYQKDREVIFKNREGELFDCSAKGVISDADDLTILRSSIQLSPNPATDWLTLTVETNSVTGYRIINALGQIVQEEADVFSNITTIDVSNLLKGIYWLSITIENQTIFQPFLKQ